MPYVTQDQLDAIVDLPVALPLTDLYPEEWLVVSTIRISVPQTLTLRWLQAYILSSYDPNVLNADGTVKITADNTGTVTLPPQNPELVTPGLGLAFVGVYRNFNSLNSPAFQAAQESPLIVGGVASVTPVAAIRSTDPTIFTSDGDYSIVVTNNTSNRLMRLLVSGQIRASMGINPAT